MTRDNVGNELVASRASAYIFMNYNRRVSALPVSWGFRVIVTMINAIYGYEMDTHHVTQWCANEKHTAEAGTAGVLTLRPLLEKRLINKMDDELQGYGCTRGNGSWKLPPCLLRRETISSKPLTLFSAASHSVSLMSFSFQWFTYTTYHNESISTPERLPAMAYIVNYLGGGHPWSHIQTFL